MPWSSQPICDDCFRQLRPLQEPTRLLDVDSETPGHGGYYSEPCWVCKEPTRGTYFRARECDACNHDVHNFDVVTMICQCCRLPKELVGRRAAVRAHHSSEP